MKANSERVKGKNFRDLAGKPLFKWILDSLLKVEEVDLVVINTDARDILLENGLEESDRVLIRERPDELRGDLVSMNLIIEDDVKNVPSDIYLMTHTTNPLLKDTTIRAALRKFNEAKQSGLNDSLFTVNKIQTRFYRANMEAINHDPSNLIRTQDLEEWYEENSNLYIFSSASFAITKARIGDAPCFYATPSLESVDIDEPDDWQMAEALAFQRVNNEKRTLSSNFGPT
jgi:CMP-N-acetylneuraminic acid synthetase